MTRSGLAPCRAIAAKEDPYNTKPGHRVFHVFEKFIEIVEIRVKLTHFSRRMQLTMNQGFRVRLKPYFEKNPGFSKIHRNRRN